MFKLTLSLCKRDGAHLSGLVVVIALETLIITQILPRDLLLTGMLVALMLITVAAATGSAVRRFSALLGSLHRAGRSLTACSLTVFTPHWLAGLLGISLGAGASFLPFFTDSAGKQQFFLEGAALTFTPTEASSIITVTVVTIGVAVVAFIFSRPAISKHARL